MFYAQQGIKAAHTALKLIPLKAKLLNQKYVYGTQRYNYVSSDKRFKTTIFGKDTVEIKTLCPFRNFIWSDRRTVQSAYLFSDIAYITESYVEKAMRAVVVALLLIVVALHTKYSLNSLL